MTRETMLRLRACCRVGKAVVDKFAEKVWYPSVFQDILESAMSGRILEVTRVEVF